MMRTVEKEEEYGVPYGADAVNADMDYINSEGFALKFERITDNPTVNRTLLECSCAAVAHRTGTLYEDMYLINGITGEIIGQQLESEYKQGIFYNESIKTALLKAKVDNIPVIAFHTHPEGYPPSIDDFNMALENNYLFGIVIGHNGQVYKYEKPDTYVYNIDIIQNDIRFAFLNGADIDRAYREAFADYGLNYVIVKG